jgi:uncharacterized membrane protein
VVARRAVVAPAHVADHVALVVSTPSTRPQGRDPAPAADEGVLAGTVREVVALEGRERSKERAQDRIVDRITAAAGSMTFVAVNVAWVATWIILNLPGMPAPFDPFPFALLPVVVSLETIVLAMLVLGSENAQARRADRRAHLEMQVNVLAEREISALVGLVAEIHEHLGLTHGDEVREMQGATLLEHVADAVDAVTAEPDIADRDSRGGATPDAI